MANGRKIMVIDDEFDIIYIVRKQLEKWGYDVDTFTNPLYAYQLFKENPERYSLLLIDIRMPEISGVTLAVMMQKVKPDIKIVIMTAFEIVADDLKMSLPAINRDDILRKPFTTDQVCAAVKKQLKIA